MRCDEQMQTNSRASSSAVDREATQTSNKRKASAFSSSETKHPFALEMAPDSLNASALFLPLAAPAATAVAPSAPTVAAPTSGRSDREPPGLGGGGGAPRGCAPVSREGDGEPAGHGKGGALTGGAPLSGRVDRRSAEQAGGGAASLGDAPLLTALTVKTVAELGQAAQTAQATRTSVSAGRVRGSLSRRSSNAHGQASAAWFLCGGGCGMVWYGMVWNGMVWSGMVWSGMGWYDMVWYGLVWDGMVWSGYMVPGMVRYEMGTVWVCSMVRVKREMSAFISQQP